MTDKPHSAPACHMSGSSIPASPLFPWSPPFPVLAPLEWPTLASRLPALFSHLILSFPKSSSLSSG